MSDNTQIPYCPTAHDMLAAWQTFLNANPDLQGTKALHFDMEDVQNLSNKATGFRVYFGLRTDDTGATKLDGMIVGVDANNNDIVDITSPTSGIYDFAKPCPAFCDMASPMMNPDSNPCS